MVLWNSRWNFRFPSKFGYPGRRRNKPLVYHDPAMVNFENILEYFYCDKQGR